MVSDDLSTEEASLGTETVRCLHVHRNVSMAYLAQE